MEWILDHWEFLVGDILVPIATLVLGFFIGKTTEKRKAKAIINGNHNNVCQNNDVVKESGDNKIGKE